METNISYDRLRSTFTRNEHENLRFYARLRDDDASWFVHFWSEFEIRSPRRNLIKNCFTPLHALRSTMTSRDIQISLQWDITNMSPFLSYSGRGRSQRGRGRGVVGRGRGRAGRGNSIDRRSNLNRNKWVRPPASAQTKHDTGDDNVGESVAKTDPKNASLPDTQAGPESNSIPISKYSHRIMKKTVSINSFWRPTR